MGTGMAQLQQYQLLIPTWYGIHDDDAAIMTIAQVPVPLVFLEWSMLELVRYLGASLNPRVLMGLWSVVQVVLP